MDEHDHAGRVDRWLQGATPGLSDEQRLILFGQALSALWGTVLDILGEITVEVVFDRVVFHAAERYPGLAALDVAWLKRASSNGPGKLSPPVASSNGATLEGLRFVLIELLSVFANLTDGVVTPPLHDALARVAFGGDERPGTSGKRNDAHGAQS